MICCELSAISHITLQKGELPLWYSVDSGCRVAPHDVVRLNDNKNTAFLRGLEAHDVERNIAV